LGNSTIVWVSFRVVSDEIINSNRAGLEVRRQVGSVNLRQAGSVNLRQAGSVSLRQAGSVSLRQAGSVSLNLRQVGSVSLRQVGSVSLNLSSLAGSDSKTLEFLLKVLVLHHLRGYSGNLQYLRQVR
jgi:hypothetical protein